MLDIYFRTDTSPLQRFAERLDKVLAAPMAADSPMRGGMEEAGHVYAEAMRERYEQASAGDGTWPPLKRRTIARKRKAGASFPERILFLTGSLFGSMTEGAAGNIFEVHKDRVRVGTRHRLARRHHEGGGNLPARTLLVAPRGELLSACVKPIADAWRETINACLAAQ